MRKISNFKFQISKFTGFLFLLLFIILNLSLMTVFTGCAAKNADVVQPAKGYFAGLQRMTRHEKVIDRLESKLFVYATYKSLALREAYIDEYARRYKMYDHQRDRLAKAEMEMDEKFNEFFIAVYTPEDRWNDFNTSESIWKIYLEDEKGDRVSPIEIKKVDVNSPLIREFYPYLDLWSSGYVIRFPKYMAGGKESLPGKDANYFRLIITGVVGSAALEWQLK